MQRDGDAVSVTKIICGGQTGADQGGLAAAELLNLQTGGWAPKGFRTERGCEQYLLRGFGLQEHAAATYPPRTKANVQDADGTVVFGLLQSSGSRLTWATCVRLEKPVHHVPYGETNNRDGMLWGFRQWLKEYDIHILNVAGNRESVAPGIQAFTRAFLIEALTGGTP